MKATHIISILGAISLAAASAAAPTGKGVGLAGNAKSDSQTDNNIIYHGGAVLNSKKGVDIYFIWYGNWSGNTATSILPTLIGDLNKSPYYKINTTYYGTDHSKFVQPTVHLKRQVNDFYSHGAALSDDAVAQVVQAQIDAGALPLDYNALYYVLTSKDVDETSGFCAQYCSWHTHLSHDNVDVKYAFVGDSARCLSACSAQAGNSPNGNPGADAMASLMAHQLDETVTDPDLDAWYFSSNEENADACAWTFGEMYTAPNGSYANMNMNGRDYLIQQNWIRSDSDGRCSLKKK